MNVRAALHRFSDLLASESPFDWERDWLVFVIVFFGSILLGPVVLLAFKLQRWNARCPWDSEDHRAGTKQFAVTFLVWDGLLLLAWFHFQAQVARLSSTAFWWWVLFHLLLWYAVLALLTPALVLLLERLDPRTVPLERVQLPTEQPRFHPSVPTRPTPKKAAAAGSEQGTNTPKKRKKGRAVPLGQLLLEEREAQREQARQLRFVQSPALSGETAVASVPPSSPGPHTATGTSKAPPAATKADRRQPESLDQLF